VKNVLFIDSISHPKISLAMNGSLKMMNWFVILLMTTFMSASFRWHQYDVIEHFLDFIMFEAIIEL